MNTRERIRRFNLAFGRPVNESWTDLTVSERELLGKLLFEEVVEYVTKGLGLQITIEQSSKCEIEGDVSNYLILELNEGQPLNPIECVDGLADVNVVAHFAAHWHGFNLDYATEVVDDSNMSKLDDEGKPIINEEIDCETCQGTGELYDSHETMKVCNDCRGYQQVLRDPTRPIGKILKSPNFREPDLQSVIDQGNE